MSSDKWESDAVFVHVEFDQSVTGHDSKGEPIPTPYCMTITCPQGFEGYAKAIFAWMLSRYGWRGDIGTTGVMDAH